jgi:threonine synthase
VETSACRCGGLFEPVLQPWAAGDPGGSERGLWRYRRWLPLPLEAEPVSLGEGGTPLVDDEVDGRRVAFKVESGEPTGSYKDRGSAVLVTALAHAGVRRAVEDSSGNAGASMAAYCARAGITLDLFVPRTATAGALRQAIAYGALVDATAATRARAAERARAAAAGGVYASHVHSAYFLAGVSTMALELAADWRGAWRGAWPPDVVVPVGHGILLLGLYLGFQALAAGGLGPPPRLWGVQAERIAPVAAAFRGDAPVDGDTAAEAGTTMAVGIAVPAPPRLPELVAALRASGGGMVAVSEAEIERARDALARRGWFLEPTAAVAVAGLRHLTAASSSHAVVVPLTGSGLKT